MFHRLTTVLIKQSIATFSFSYSMVSLLISKHFLGSSNSFLDLIYTSSVIIHCLTQIVEASYSFYYCSVNIDFDFWFVLILLITIAFVFLSFIFILYNLPTSFTLFIMFCKFSSLSASKTVSSAYRKLLIWVPPIVTPLLSSMCLKMVSVYELKRHGDNTHPCLTPLLIRISSERLLSSRIDHTHIYIFHTNLTLWYFKQIFQREWPTLFSCKLSKGPLIVLDR